jgi:hypothetical protein
LTCPPKKSKECIKTGNGSRRPCKGPLPAIVMHSRPTSLNSTRPASQRHGSTSRWRVESPGMVLGMSDVSNLRWSHHASRLVSSYDGRKRPSSQHNNAKAREIAILSRIQRPFPPTRQARQCRAQTAAMSPPLVSVSTPCGCLAPAGLTLLCASLSDSRLIRFDTDISGGTTREE